MKTQMKKISGWGQILCLTALFGMYSCTDLEVETPDSVVVNQGDEAGFQGISDPSSFVENSFNSLRGLIGDQANLFALSEVTTDAALIPTRGGDWGDNGLWRQLHQHNWNSEHQFFLNVFRDWNNLHFQATQVLDPLTDADAETKANASFLRALGMFVVVDNFRQVPVRDPNTDDTVAPEVLLPSDVLPMIVSDLEFAITNLPNINPGGNNVRPGKSAARYLLAKVLLNKHVYLETTPDNADMNRVVSLVDAIQADGYGLVDGYFDIFKQDLDNETIWFIDTAVGNRIWNGLHYNSAPVIAGGGWNGFATLSEYFDLFEGNPDINVEGSGQEERRGFVPTAGLPIGAVPGGSDANDNGIADGSEIGNGFLLGQQYNEDGSLTLDRQGAPLKFTREFVDGNGAQSLINNGEETGIRVIKYNPRFGGFTNHEIFFRYSDAHLMKAEALLRSGGDATPLVNELRILRDASPLGSVTAQELIDERGRELYMELWRRNDLVRFSQYTKDWEFKVQNAIDNPIRNVFPIPLSQLVANPNLVQNPGY
ncbi:RagB/SusD family nutrient uptake outer membrane protein [Dokdonia sinensis]|uniref:RagB/SusD family nutrient uptake outer membrane protein n=1 Tax=Dokdonia sinensis TaxID=2479847 RepID=A0A3M0G830_9FLAO|nr:RagB/SusD family nutrient uptake outer membrane protein [Dokdonia sinensis]RMB58562.1 RagB/SusD family nutrient uptake outer membrane protein [Dokdonia sinensis]